jgi:hypothetical protein
MIEQPPTARRRRFIYTGRVASAVLGAGAAAVLATALSTAADGATASICDKVSAAQVSAIVGHSVPSPTQSVVHLPADKNDYEISSVDTSCTYGSDKSLAGIAKAVTLDISVSAKPFTEAEILASTKKAEELSHSAFKLVSYSGLGVPGFYLTETADGLHLEVLSGISGTHSFGAAVDSTLAMSKLVELAKLAAKL